MNTGSFKESNIKIAEKQEEFHTVEAFHNPNAGTITYCLELSKDEILDLFMTQKIWAVQQTNNGPMQPMFFTVNKDEVL